MIATLQMPAERIWEAECHLEGLMRTYAEEHGLTDTRWGFSQNQLSEKTGLSMTTIRSLIRGGYNRIDLDTAATLMEFFGCEFSDLFTIRLK